MGEEAFFDDIQGAAVLKHGVLRRYLPPAALKVASVTSDGVIYYLDTHAGPGAYRRGVPGSPSLAAATAERIAAYKTNARLRCIYVEKDKELFARLKERVATVDHVHRCIEGGVEECIEEIMKEVGDAPLFTFTDPFGLGVPFNLLSKRLLRRSRHEGGKIISPITEMLMNFSLPGLRRNAGKVFGKGREAATMGDRMDETFGGDWWRAIWLASDEDREEQIFRKYVRKLALPGGYRAITGPVSDRWERPPSYYLVYLTKSKQGVGLFVNSVALAMEEFYEFTHEGQFDLEPRTKREAQWAPIMEENVRRLLVDRGDFTVGDHIPEVYGSTLGYAGEPQLRAVLKAMCKSGEIETKPENAIRNVYKLRISAGPGS